MNKRQRKEQIQAFHRHTDKMMIAGNRIAKKMGELTYTINSLVFAAKTSSIYRLISFIQKISKQNYYLEK